jgi:hypothetical protein
MKVILRQDGTVVVVSDTGDSYHVVSKDIDPYNKYDLVEMLQYAQDHPEDVIEEPKPPEPTLDDHKSQGLQSVEALLPKILEKGFLYGQDRIQADPVAQQNATGFLTAISAGVPVPFPVEWRTKANTTVLIPDLDSYRFFAALMLQFVQQVFHDVWNTKDNIRASESEEAITTIVQEFKDRHEI